MAAVNRTVWDCMPDVLPEAPSIVGVWCRVVQCSEDSVVAVGSIAGRGREEQEREREKRLRRALREACRVDLTGNWPLNLEQRHCATASRLCK